MRILNVRYTQLPGLSFGITDAAEAQVYRKKTNAAESLSRKIGWEPVPHPAMSISGALSSGIGVNVPNGKELRNTLLKYGDCSCIGSFTQRG